MLFIIYCTQFNKPHTATLWIDLHNKQCLFDFWGIVNILVPYSYSGYWTRSGSHWRLIRGDIFKKKYAFEKTPHISPSCRLVPGRDSHRQGTGVAWSRDACWKFWKKKHCKRYQDSVLWVWIQFCFIGGTNYNNTLINTDVSWIANLKGTVEVPAVDLSRFNILRCTKLTFLTS